jgi:hypothetical protein
MIDVLQFLLGVGILGALAGIIGVLIAQILTARRESRALLRERDGLLRILYPEVSMTHRDCNWLKSKYDQGQTEVAAALATRHQYARTDTWEATRVKLAQQTPPEQGMWPPRHLLSKSPGAPGAGGPSRTSRPNRSKLHASCCIDLLGHTGATRFA